jgi:DNA-binding NtrC family response regulator
MKKRILLVEVDVSIRDALKKVLRHTGYDVSAPEPDTARSKLASAPVDLLLLDVDGLNQNGWNLLGYVTSQWPLIPAIIITSSADRPVPGIGTFLEKPIDMPVLLKALEDSFIESVSNRLSNLTYPWPDSELSPGEFLSRLWRRLRYNCHISRTTLKHR